MNGLSHSGGMERVVSNLLKYWVEDYNIIILTKDDGSCFYPIPNGIQRLSLTKPMKMDMGNRVKRVLSVFLSLMTIIPSLRRMLKELKYDYLYVSNPLNAFEVYLANKKNANKKLVISEHASINAWNSLYMRMKHFVYPKSYCISVPNSMDTPVYRTWGCNAVYIPHLFSFTTDYNIDEKEKVVLNVGRLTDDKQQVKLLNIWSKIVNKNDWVLWIVGNGENKKMLEQFIEDNNLSDSVKMIPAQKDIQSIYRKASIFAFTSRCEGFGMVLLEAMAFGIPCISYDCPSGPRDVIKNGGNGYLIENDNETAYISKLQDMLSMSDVEYEKLRQGAYQTIENWDNQGIINKWKKIFK